MFSVLIWVMDPWAEAKYVKIHLKVHLRFVYFTVCKLYLKKTASEDFREWSDFFQLSGQRRRSGLERELQGEMATFSLLGAQ